MSLFSEREFLRYSRHIQLPQVGIDGQQRLLQSTVLLVGCGGLGAPVALYLAAAGVGRIILIDGDQVELSNLQRQIVFDESMLGLPKAQCAAQRLRSLNSDIEVVALDQALTQDNVDVLVRQSDLVLDCSDNQNARYLINDCCRRQRKTWLFASVYQFSGQLATFSPDGGCYRCLHPEPTTLDIDCNVAGVLGALPGIVGSMQSCEAIRILTGHPAATAGCLLMFEADEFAIERVLLARDPKCKVCNDGMSGEMAPTAACTLPRQAHVIPASEFHRYAARSDVLVIDVRDDNERRAFDLGGEHIPLASLPTRDDLPIEKLLVFYCQSGVRSLIACETLIKQGYSAVSVAGGMVEILKNSPF